MAWPATLYEEALPGEGAKVLGQDLFDRDEIAAERRTFIYYAQSAETGAFPQTMVTGWKIRHPSWVESGDSLIWAHYAAQTGAITGGARLVVGGVNGTTSSITSGTIVRHESAVSLGAVGGTVESVVLQLGVQSGTGTVTVYDNYATNLYYEGGFALGGARGNYASDKACRTGRVADLVARDLATFEVPFYYDFTEKTTTSTITDGVQLATFSLPQLDVFDGKTLRLLCDAWVTPTGTAQFRLTSGSNNGTWISATATSQTEIPTALDVVYDASGTTALYGKVDVGTNTAHIVSTNRITWWFE